MRRESLRLPLKPEVERQHARSQSPCVTRSPARFFHQVTKRSFEAPADGSFGTSEYARLAEAGTAGVLNAVPVIRAARTQVRYRWEPSALPASVSCAQGVAQGVNGSVAPLFGSCGSFGPAWPRMAPRQRSRRGREELLCVCVGEKSSLIRSLPHWRSFVLVSRPT
mgnify:CR=1 FL=1